MFNFWSPNGQGGAPSSSSIKEANEQMQAMLGRIRDLEQRVNEQKELMNRREYEHSARVQNLERQSDLEKAALQQDIAKLKERLRQMEGMLKERDVQIAYMFHRCSYLDEAASYVPLLDQLSQCLKSSLASPPPKVQTVKPTRAAVPNGSEFTPDVPNAPANDKANSAPAQTNAAATLAEHFAPKQHAPTLPPKQQARPIHDYPHYQEAVASVYAANPNVAMNKK